jgi:hypothetical protein
LASEIGRSVAIGGSLKRVVLDVPFRLSVNRHADGPSIAHLVGQGVFFGTHLLGAGFLDGRHGFMLAISNAEGTYYKYLKAMLAAEARRGAPRDDVD